MINNTSKTDNFLRADAIAAQVPRPAVPAQKNTTTERLSASSQETLQAVLREQPEVRPEVVARGQQLLVDANYPPREIIRQLSELLIGTADLAE
jgi:hypothetical protein